MAHRIETSFKVGASAAEGVETATQAETLTELGCELAQGYYFSRPINDTTFSQVLADAFAPRAPGRRTPVATAT